MSVHVRACTEQTELCHCHLFAAIRVYSKDPPMRLRVGGFDPSSGFPFLFGFFHLELCYGFN